MEREELKPCPFCGGKAKVKVCDGSGTYFTDIGTEVLWGRKMTHCLIRCEKCRVRTQAYLTRRGVFNAWNRRANNKQIEGKWITNRSPIEAEFKCSECGYSYIEADPHTKTEYNYCPNCGAKMKGGE